MSKRGMIEEALKLWLRQGDRPADQVPIAEDNPIHAATPEEIEIAAAAIALVRGGNQTEAEILDTVLRRYRGRMTITKKGNHAKGK